MFRILNIDGFSYNQCGNCKFSFSKLCMLSSFSFFRWPIFNERLINYFSNFKQIDKLNWKLNFKYSMRCIVYCLTIYMAILVYSLQFVFFDLKQKCFKNGRNSGLKNIRINHIYETESKFVINLSILTMNSIHWILLHQRLKTQQNEWIYFSSKPNRLSTIAMIFLYE